MVLWFIRMKINIIAVGKIKEKFLRDAIAEYAKRLSKFCICNIIEISESVARIENEANIKKVKEEEGRNILSKINNEYVIVLDIDGKDFSTMELYERIEKIKLDGESLISFVVGGSYGLSDEVKNRANLRLSFSKLTFPHQLFRVILLEQIYRIFKIENNEPYHK